MLASIKCFSFMKALSGFRKANDQEDTLKGSLVTLTSFTHLFILQNHNFSSENLDDVWTYIVCSLPIRFWARMFHEVLVGQSHRAFCWKKEVDKMEDDDWWDLLFILTNRRPCDDYFSCYEFKRLIIWISRRGSVTVVAPATSPFGCWEVQWLSSLHSIFLYF